VNRLCKDIEFMLGFRPNLYWRLCWWVLTPGLMTVILVYTLLNLSPLKNGDIDYPPVAHIVGYCISGLGLIQLPIFAIYAICKQKESSLWKVNKIDRNLISIFHFCLLNNNDSFSLSLNRKSRKHSNLLRNGVQLS
jgi:hypothetical protein